MVKNWETNKNTAIDFAEHSNSFLAFFVTQTCGTFNSLSAQSLYITSIVTFSRPTKKNKLSMTRSAPMVSPSTHEHWHSMLVALRPHFSFLLSIRLFCTYFISNAKKKQKRRYRRSVASWDSLTWIICAALLTSNSSKLLYPKLIITRPLRTYVRLSVQGGSLRNTNTFSGVTSTILMLRCKPSACSALAE